ncbi:hypothetical protein LIER_22993 [Lithospermum erythrorhizon]|uniref:Reverse transcriptase domain-containing protein n=1 Tax=Lithospermum erythrorhizon TaxID=34254 RepID=A0AAV3R023_LITER
MDFPKRFIYLISQCVQSANFSVFINGSLQGHFKSSQGLRQGDPLSPYLFLLAMEVLGSLLREESLKVGFVFHPKYEIIGLTHLLFADDMFLLCGANVDTLNMMYWASCFSLPSRLIKEFEKYIRGFIWQGNCGSRGTELVSWKQWSKVCMAKLLWDICRKKDSMWVIWVHTYRHKSCSI